MRSRASAFILTALLAGPARWTTGCGQATSARSSALTATQTAKLSISGMTCASCAVTVKTAVKKLDGIASVQVDVDKGEATVSFDASKVTADQIAQAITRAGYQATVRSTDGV